MKTIQTDKDNDFVIGADGNLVILSDIDALAQESRHYAATNAGEMIHAVDEGIPYINSIFVRQPSLVGVETALRERLLQLENVISIKSLEVQIDGETMSYVAVLNTEFGDVNING